jgi:hypothetical protein
LRYNPTAKHVTVTLTRARALLAGCGANCLRAVACLDEDQVAEYLAGLRQDRPAPDSGWCPPSIERLSV